MAKKHNNTKPNNIDNTDARISSYGSVITVTKFLAGALFCTALSFAAERLYDCYEVYSRPKIVMAALNDGDFDRSRKDNNLYIHKRYNVKIEFTKIIPLEDVFKRHMSYSMIGVYHRINEELAPKIRPHFDPYGLESGTRGRFWGLQFELEKGYTDAIIYVDGEEFGSVEFFFGDHGGVLVETPYCHDFTINRISLGSKIMNAMSVFRVAGLYGVMASPCLSPLIDREEIEKQTDCGDVDTKIVQSKMFSKYGFSTLAKKLCRNMRYKLIYYNGREPVDAFLHYDLDVSDEMIYETFKFKYVDSDWITDFKL